ncbi:hypothetical protein EIY71_18915 [Pseudomonas sp. CH235]|nr:hypothetical protein EIY71_18915 [Pseudomonas sp. CH235]
MNKKARGSAPESLKIKPLIFTKQSDNRLSVRLSNRLLSAYHSVTDRSHALRGNAARDAPRPFRSRTRSILCGQFDAGTILQ